MYVFMYLFVYLAASSLRCAHRIFVRDVGSFLAERGLSRWGLWPAGHVGCAASQRVES